MTEIDEVLETVPDPKPARKTYKPRRADTSGEDTGHDGSPVSPTKLKTFIDAVEFAADVDGWMPSKRQWKRIRHMISCLEEQQSGGMQYPVPAQSPYLSHYAGMPAGTPPAYLPPGNVNRNPDPASAFPIKQASSLAELQGGLGGGAQPPSDGDYVSAFGV